MKLINRHQLAEKLGMTPRAVSIQVSRRNWDAVPCPGKFGGVFKWLDEDVDKWIQEKLSEPFDYASQTGRTKRRRGRPRKTKSYRPNSG